MLVEGVIYGAQQLVHHLRRLLDVLVPLPRDQDVHVLLLRVVVLEIPPLTVLHRALAPNGDAGVGLPLQALLRVPAGSDDQAEEVVARELLDRDVDLLHLLLRPVVGGGTEPWAVPQQRLDHPVALLDELLPHAYGARVQAHPVSVVHRLRGGRPLALRAQVPEVPRHEPPGDVGKAVVQLRHLRRGGGPSPGARGGSPGQYQRPLRTAGGHRSCPHPGRIRPRRLRDVLPPALPLPLRRGPRRGLLPRPRGVGRGRPRA